MIQGVRYIFKKCHSVPKARKVIINATEVPILLAAKIRWQSNVTNLTIEQKQTLWTHKEVPEYHKCCLFVIPALENNDTRQRDQISVFLSMCACLYASVEPFSCNEMNGNLPIRWMSCNEDNHRKFNLISQANLVTVHSNGTHSSLNP